MTTKRAKRTQANPDATSVVGEGRDRDILAAMVWAGYLTTGQVTTLFCPTRRRAQRRLRALLDHGLVRAHLQGEALQRETFFTPTPKGVEWLDAREAFVGGVPRTLPLPRLQKLAHALGIRDVFVEFLRGEHEGLFVLDDFRFDGDLAGDARFAPERLIPDGVAHVRCDGLLYEVGVEYDRGTETTTTLRAKFRSWATVLSRVSAADPQALRLLVAVEGARREATVRRIVAEVGAHPWTATCEREAVRAFLASGWPYGVAARTGRTERLAAAPETTGFQPRGVVGRPAFGASARPGR